MQIFFEFATTIVAGGAWRRRWRYHRRHKSCETLRSRRRHGFRSSFPLQTSRGDQVEFVAFGNPSLKQFPCLSGKWAENPAPIQFQFWPNITNELIHAAIDRRVKVRVLMSNWTHTRWLDLSMFIICQCRWTKNYHSFKSKMPIFTVQSMYVIHIKRCKELQMSYN